MLWGTKTLLLGISIQLHHENLIMKSTFNINLGRCIFLINALKLTSEQVVIKILIIPS